MKYLLRIALVVLPICALITLISLIPHTGNATETDDPPNVSVNEESTITTVIPNTDSQPNHTTPAIPPQTMPPVDSNTQSNQTYTLTFVGDCTLGTMPEWMSYTGCFTQIVKQNYDHPFNNVRSYFENDDCTFINLEGVFANEGKAEDKQFTFRGPTDYINILTGSSVEVANLSNNHTFDFGQAGYNSTVQILKENGVRYIPRSGTSLYTTPSGLTIGMYGVYFNLDEKDMKADIAMLRAAGADIIVAAAHWGIEREYIQNSYQTSMAHKLIDAGVDIVWGHHPHVLQPIEIYKNGIIYYSLGNFSFGGNHNPSDKDTAILQQHIIQHADGTITLGTLNVIPCRLSSATNKNDFQPTPYDKNDEGYARVLRKLNVRQSASDAPESNQSGNSSNASPAPQKPVTEKPQPSKPTYEEKLQQGYYTLRRSFGFYRGTTDMGTITKIVFTRQKPAKYDEKWYANLKNTDDITGYRDGTAVYIVGEHIFANEYSGYMFARLNAYDEELWGNLQSVQGLELLDMSTCERTPCMFYEQLWTEINGISEWDMSQVYDMAMMFADCVNITTVDIANWNVSNVSYFNGLFQGHSWAGDMKLTHVDVSQWNTSSATDMSHMFYGCAQLTYIPLENWDVSNVKYFSHTFADCYALLSPDLSKWDTSSVLNFDAMFNDCHSFVSIDVSGLDTQSCQQFSQMFEACINLQEIIGLDTWDVSQASNAAFEQMFHQCKSLTMLDLSSWHAKPDDTAWMFRGCVSLKEVNLSNLDMSQVDWVTEMFGNCISLTTIVWKAVYDFTAIEGYEDMYKSCPLEIAQEQKQKDPHIK